MGKRKQPAAEPENTKSREELTRWVATHKDRLVAAGMRAATVLIPIGVQLFDTGGHEDGDEERWDACIAALAEAHEKIGEILGEAESSRDMGKYGEIFWRGQLPAELQVQLESIVMTYKEQVFDWQRRCGEWRADKAILAEAAKIRAEEAAAAAAKPRGRGRRKGKQDQ